MRLFKSKKGQGLVEYAILVAVIVAIIAVAAGFVKGGMCNVASRSGDNISTATVS